MFWCQHVQSLLLAAKYHALDTLLSVPPWAMGVSTCWYVLKTGARVSVANITELLEMAGSVKLYFWKSCQNLVRVGVGEQSQKKGLGHKYAGPGSLCVPMSLRLYSPNRDTRAARKHQYKDLPKSSSPQQALGSHRRNEWEPWQHQINQADHNTSDN